MNGRTPSRIDRPLPDGVTVQSGADAGHQLGKLCAYLSSIADSAPPEHIYLDTLARELGLEAGLVGEIHAAVLANRAET